MRRFWAGIAIGTVFAGAVVLPSSPAMAATPKVPFGHYHKVGENWKVKVLARDLNANAEVAAASDENDPPPHGYRYVTVEVRAKKLTNAGYNHIGYDETFELRSTRPAHRVYNDYTTQIIPKPSLGDSPNVTRGEREHGNVLFLVRKADLRKGHFLLRVESFTFDDVEYFRLS